MKICSKCLMPKNTDDFYKNRRSKDGLFYCCKICCYDKEKEYRKTDRGRQNRKNQRKRYTQSGKAKKLNKTLTGKYLSYKHAALKRNIIFNLTKEQFEDFWQQPCYYCNSSIETIGLDRIDNKLGYELSNIVPCCKLCNTKKNNLTIEDMKFFISKIEDFLNKK